MTNIIQELNDNFRKTFIGGQIVLTDGIYAKPQNKIISILSKVRRFDNFTESNDTHQEHDFGSFDFEDDKIFWKIDYYDKDFKYLSEEPANIDKTSRVMTIMLAEEY